MRTWPFQLRPMMLFFERSGNAAFVPGAIAPIFTQLDYIWSDRGIQSKVTKHVDRVSDGVALGLQLVQGKYLVPKVERLCDLLCGVILLLSTKRTSEKHFATFFGVLQWTLLVNRPLLSCCHYVYGFLDVENDTVVDIPMKVLNELGLITTLIFATAVDLRAGWAPFVWATDGAESFGYGGASAPCHPDVTKYLASFVHIEGHQFIPTDIYDKTEVVNPSAVEMPLRYRDFKRRFSQRSTKRFHASKLEAGALGIAVRAISRQAMCHRQRVLLLVDAKALLFAVRKGRSSAPSFIHGLRGIAALALAADLRMHFGYIASAHNPADPPSRGAVNKCGKVQRRAVDQRNLNSIVAHAHFLKRVTRRCRASGTLPRRNSDPTWSSSCSSSALAQPSSRA